MKFRMIMPVYNAGDYLKKAIDSIIGQTLSFRENITIHLIDDASEDDSLAICREYEKQYPKNIKVTHFEQNKGVSAVRNFGLKCSRWKLGTIVGFIDCDDYIESDALEKVQTFFETHKDIRGQCGCGYSVYYQRRKLQKNCQDQRKWRDSSFRPCSRHLHSDRER